MIMPSVDNPRSRRACRHDGKRDAPAQPRDNKPDPRQETTILHGHRLDELYPEQSSPYHELQDETVFLARNAQYIDANAFEPAGQLNGVEGGETRRAALSNNGTGNERGQEAMLLPGQGWRGSLSRAAAVADNGGAARCEGRGAELGLSRVLCNAGTHGNVMFT